MAEGTYRVTWRDRLAYRLCQLIIKIATPEYRALLWLGHYEAMVKIAQGVRREMSQQPGQQK